MYCSPLKEKTSNSNEITSPTIYPKVSIGTIASMIVIYPPKVSIASVISVGKPELVGKIEITKPRRKVLIPKKAFVIIITNHHVALVLNIFLVRL